MASRPPKGLRTRGKDLWKRLDVEANTPEGILAEETCRIADRIDQIFDLMDGGDDDAVIREMTYRLDDYFPGAEGNAHLEVKLTGLQNEMRQQQALLRQMMLAVVGMKKFLNKDDLEDDGPHAKAQEADGAEASGMGRPRAQDKSTLSEFSQRRQRRLA